MFIRSDEVGGAKRLGQALPACLLSTSPAGTSTQGSATAASTRNEPFYGNEGTFSLSLHW